VQSADPDWYTAHADRHGIDASTSSVSEAVARDDVDAVEVSSRNAKHRDQVTAAAGAGKHVPAEKPLALTLEAARAWWTPARRLMW
jgi:predicted dehydrogenase